MPTISRIRFTNVVYENGRKRYNDDIFQFDGYNGAILLENGGGKTVFIQTVIQAILPHHDIAERKIRETLSLEGSPCHIAIEWIINERPRRYLLTAVTLFISNNKLDSYKYVYEYSYNDDHNIETIPFIKINQNGQKRPASKGEISDYYQYMAQQYMDAKVFKTIKDFHSYIEENYQIVPAEWRNIALINSAEGGIEAFFEGCKTTTQLVDKLLIPVVEEAASGNCTKDFVDSFDKQRERFKRHKQLRERIEESEKIRAEIDKYVNIFSQQYNASIKYDDKRAYAKALYKYVEDEKNNTDKELLEVKNYIKEIEELMKELEKKKASYELAIIKKELEEKKDILEEARKEFNHIFNKYQSMSKEKLNLEIAKFKYDIKQSVEKINSYKLELKVYEEDTDIKDIRIKLDENSSKLKGYYLTQEDRLNRGKTLYEGQRDNNLDQLQTINNKIEEQLKQKENLAEDINRKYGQIEQIEKNLKNILSKLFNVSKHDNIKEKRIHWSNKIGKLEKEVATNNEKIANLENEKTKISTNLSTMRKRFEEIKTNYTLVEEKIKTIDKEQEDLLINAKEANSMWYTYNSLYVKQESILSYVRNKAIKLNNDREEILQNERIASRFSDFYKDSKYFSPEPLLENKVETWKSQLAYVELGIRYIERIADNLGNDVKDYFKIYPYWGLSVIVSDGDLTRLIEKIKDMEDKITYPIFIITESEAREILNGIEKIDEHTIFPKYWEDNMDSKSFELWKKQLLDKVDEIKKARNEKETEIKRTNILLTKLEEFYSKYPYDYYQELVSNKGEFKNKIYDLQINITKIENRIIEIDGEISRLNKNSNDHNQEINTLNNWVDLATQYINGERDKENLELYIKELNEKVKVKDHELSKLKREKLQKEDMMLDLRNKIDGIIRDINKLKDEDTYKEVKDVQPIYVDLTKKGLEEERKTLRNILHEKESNIETIQNNIKREENTKKEREVALNRKRVEAEYEIDEEFEFPVYGDEKIDELISEINNLKPIKQNLENRFNNANKEYEKKQNEYEIREKDYYKIYEDIIVFSDSLYKVKLELEKEETQLKEKKSQKEREEKRFEKEQKNIESILHRLKVEDAKHRFGSDLIEEKELDNGTRMDFPYNRSDYLDDLDKELESLKSNLDNYNKKVEEQKRIFITFCDREIEDPRLRERTVSGVRGKNKYEDIINWQNKMRENISKTIQIAEDDMREHDKDLQQFIQHLYTYLARLTEELRIIPKNTRIKVDDRWKEIFRFDVPKWNEQEGKEELKKHVDWMINQLDSNDFKNEDGSENYAAIRKEIEKWLNSKQLLKIVFKNNSIKVSCRKVTNDGKISSAPTTWENSNKWSGGEKWSKNMTLFLGILNYLAEKKHSSITGRKVSRTVIVDNPFGRASSDHVLDPVFFIAEKLGFQMIALTAHTEGKYIRNYFPVIYSCKLRESVNGNTSIMYKEKEIQYAFFKDNDPQAIIRLGEQEQMSLF